MDWHNKTYLLAAVFNVILLHMNFIGLAQDLNTEIKNQLFPGTKPTESTYTFPEKFLEKTIPLADNTKLNGVLFPAKNSKGLIFYLHGSNDDISTWGKIAPLYTSINYDLFIIDYRGYGKSEGTFQDEDLWYQDIQEVYNYLKIAYNENSIIILGQSLGTAAASFLGARNTPRMVILQAPFYNMKEWLLSLDPNADPSQLNFQFPNNENLTKIKAPVYIFHGDNDQAVDFKFSLKLKKLFKEKDRLFILKNEGHNDFSKNKDYRRILADILSD